MSPIDDELRTALHRRADAPGLVPADPLAGIERRARGMRRRRAATAVTGSALAVALVAVGAASLGGSTVTAIPDRGFATEAPATAEPEPDPTYVAPPPASDTVLDPADPWPYRGDPLVLENGNLDAVRSEYAVRHPGARVEALFGQGYEPSGTSEIVFVATAPTGPRWGVSQATESGPEFVVDEELPEGGTNALVAALAGDEQARLLVVATPAAERAEYIGGTTPAAMFELPGWSRAVFTHPLAGDPLVDRVRVLDGDGATLYEDAAPDGPDSQGTRPDSDPENVLLDWPSRGTADDALATAAVRAWERGRPEGTTGSYVLFTGADDAGNRYLLAQMWKEGDQLADTVGYVERPGQEPELQLKTRAVPDQPVLAMLVTAAPGQSTDTLVVVPRPRTGQVLYGEAASEYRPISGQDFRDGVVLIDRRQETPDDAGDLGDRLRLLDGDGVQYFDGPVRTLLCGVKTCS